MMGARCKANSKYKKLSKNQNKISKIKNQIQKFILFL